MHKKLQDQSGQKKYMSPYLSCNNLLTRRHSFYELNTKEQVEVNKDSHLFELKIRLIDGKNINLKVNKLDTIKHIKKIIADIYFKKYLPEQTVLQYQGKVIPNFMAIKFTIAAKTQIIELVQRKADLHEVDKLTVDPNKEDPISCEKGVAKLKCGHEIGRQALKNYVQSTLKSGLNVFQCPYSRNGSGCTQLITKLDLILICGYSRQQIAVLDDKLSLTWVNNNTKLCPHCKEVVDIDELKTRRVSCPKCKKADFCYDCLQKWNCDESGRCRNDVCSIKRTQATMGGLTRQFKVTDQKSGKIITVMTPEFRACPRCGNIINNYQACKHTRCPCMNMGNSFCFICLGLVNNNRWPCGGYDDYCGKVAPKQDLK